MKSDRRGAGPAWTRPGRHTREDVEPMEARGHWLLCAVCARGGCRRPPPGRSAVNRLLRFMWAYPFAPVRIMADHDVTRAHYSAASSGRNARGLPKDFARRRDDFVWRRKDLEVCRVLGIYPGTVLPAYLIYAALFARRPTLEGICRTGSRPSADWPECPHARSGFYEKIAGEPRADLHRQHLLGERLTGRGLWAMVRPRSRADMLGDKRRSARNILREAPRLYIRPSHCLCILCNTCRDPGRKPLAEDNLVELFRRMTREPDIPVTLSEGCCMVCDPCNVYHRGENLCYHAHLKSSLRDLMVLERLGLAPGTTLPARELYRRIYGRIGSLKEICGWRDGSSTAPFWAPCNYDRPVLEEARRMGLITGRPERKGRTKRSGSGAR